MVDFATQSRHYGYKYNTPDIRTPKPTYRDIYRENEPKLFKTPRVPVHDCRVEAMKDITEPKNWEVWLLASGLKHSYESATALHKIRKRDESGASQRDKLLITIGKTGSETEQFRFPKTVLTTESGSIYVVDSGNHRVQVFNQFGVFIRFFGEKGSGPGQFNEPTGLTRLTGGYLAVADQKNGRIQIMTDNGDFKFEFSTVDRPFYICSDALDNLVVSTTTGHIEIYGRSARLLHRFSVSGQHKTTKKENSPYVCPIALNNKNEVLVVNAEGSLVQYYTYGGELLYQFEPVSAGRGLVCQPSAVQLNKNGEIILADGLNHVVNVYSERGDLLAVLIGPTDGAGAVQSVALGPEGHLVASEYSLNGEHCLKIYRYIECNCHRTRPGSAKKRTAKTDNK